MPFMRKKIESNKCLLVVLQEKTSPVSVCGTQVGKIISYVRKGKKWAKRRRKRDIQAPSQQDRRAAQSRCLGRGEGASAIPSPTPPTHLSAMVAFPVEELVFDDALLPRGAPGEPDARL